LNFAGDELKDTEGVLSIFDLDSSKLFGIVFFAAFIAIGYDAFVMMLIQIGGGKVFESDPLLSQLPYILFVIIIGFLVIFPFIQFLYLSRPGEDSSIPVDTYLERLLEKVSSIVKSPLIATILVYFFTYMLPIYIIYQYLPDFKLITAILLWATILPLISLGALAGTGFGEDLNRLRMVRSPFRDLFKLGLPKISIRQLKVDIGGLFLVIIAIQALITTTYFGINGIFIWLDISVGPFNNQSTQNSAGFLINLILLLITLFNKGRGSVKELKQVWTESGFKVNALQIFLPVFVFLGVLLTSGLELFIQRSGSGNYGVLAEFDLQSHYRITSFFLVIQNFVLVLVAIRIFRNPPGSVERRLVKEIPNFYKNDVNGYLYMFNKFKSPRSLENLIIESTKLIDDNPKNIELLKGIINKSLVHDSPRVQRAAAEFVTAYIDTMVDVDMDMIHLNTLILNSTYTPVKIFGIRNLKRIIQFLDEISKENAIQNLIDNLGHEDDVVSWDAGLTLQRVVFEDPKYRNFVLALVIKTLATTNNQSTIDSIKRFLHKISETSNEVGQMAVSTLGTQLASGISKNEANLLEGIKSVLRGNSSLGFDLIDQVSLGTNDPDESVRKRSYQVLVNLAQYSERLEEEILSLVLKGISDDSIEIQTLAYSALKNEVQRSALMSEQVFQIINGKFTFLRGDPLFGALDVASSLIILDVGLERNILKMISGAINSSTPLIRARVLELCSQIAEKIPELSDDIYLLAESNLGHADELVRERAVNTVGMCVVGNSELAKPVYRKINALSQD
ncbi:MAG: hypothetical protein OEZ01_15895, partial [Candidatus Heimdallarchaeota archaeon]|nr:hypothetical protein [Candidatus Heimdallarchaeota archaeon]